MQTHLASWAKDTDLGNEADAILRRCVHCGFCTATCPTYQVLGDELDSPRGRIYLIKQVLEGAEPTQSTQQHLDRCLTCRNCETTCPSGVQYGHLIDIGRKIVDERVPRSWPSAPSASCCARPCCRRCSVPRCAWARPCAAHCRRRCAARCPSAAIRRLPQVAGHARQVLMLAGCVQPSMMPTIDAATIRVLDALGIGARIAPGRAAAARSASTWMNRTRRWRRCAPTSTHGGRWCATDASRPS